MVFCSSTVHGSDPKSAGHTGGHRVGSLLEMAASNSGCVTSLEFSTESSFVPSAFYQLTFVLSGWINRAVL